MQTLYPDSSFNNRGPNVYFLNSVGVVRIDTVFIYAVFLVLLSPAVVVYFNHPSDELKEYILSIFLSLFVLIVVRLIFVFSFESYRPIFFRSYCDRGLVNTLLISSFLLSFLLVTILIVQSPNVQLYDSLMSINHGEDSRFSQDSVNPIVVLMFELARRVIIPAACIWYIYANKYVLNAWANPHLSIFSRMRFFIIFFVGLLFSAITMDRSPVMQYIIVFSTAMYYSGVFSGKSRTRMAVNVMGMFVLSLFLASIISMYQYGSERFDVGRMLSVVEYVFTERIFGSPLEMALRVYHSYGYEKGFLGMENIRLFAYIFGDGYISSRALGVANSITPSTYVADLWRYGGYLGVLFGTLFLSIVLNVFAMRFMRSTLLSFSLYIIAIVAVLMLIHGKFYGVLFWAVMLLIFLIDKFIIRVSSKTISC